VALAPSYKNNGGFTLVEVMVAMIIMVVGMFGLLEAVNVAMEHNLRNHMRDEAIYVGESVMNDLRGKPFDKLSSSYSTRSVPSKLRGVVKNYSVDSTTIGMGDSKQLQVIVRWTYKNRGFQNQVVSVRSQ